MDAMKRMIYALALLLTLNSALAGDWSLVRVPAPQNPQSLTALGFQLFERAGDYWIGSLPKGSPLPYGGQILDAYNSQGGEVYRLFL